MGSVVDDHVVEDRTAGIFGEYQDALVDLGADVLLELILCCIRQESALVVRSWHHCSPMQDRRGNIEAGGRGVRLLCCNSVNFLD